jgi:hypothetical protein
VFRCVGYSYRNVLRGSSRLGVVMVSVLAIGPKVRGFKPGRGGWGVKPEVPCRKILRYVKEPCVASQRYYVS